MFIGGRRRERETEMFNMSFHSIKLPLHIDLFQVLLLRTIIVLEIRGVCIFLAYDRAAKSLSERRVTQIAGMTWTTGVGLIAGCCFHARWGANLKALVLSPN